MLKTDPALAFKVFFGPATPYQYRLQGPGAWNQARKHIFTQWERTYQPLKTRPCDVEKSGTWNQWVLVIVAIIAYFMMF